MHIPFLKGFLVSTLFFLAANSTPTKRTVSILPSCTAQERGALLEEIKGVMEMARVAAKRFASDPYMKAFFPATFYDSRSWQIEMEVAYGRIAEIFRKSFTDEHLSVTCVLRGEDHKYDDCQAGALASIQPTDRGGYLINICTEFWKEGRSTAKMLEYCTVPVGGKLPPIAMADVDLSRARLLLHEITHTVYAMGSLGRAEDYAYGLEDCLQLPKGTFDRGKADYPVRGGPQCPDPAKGLREGKCPPKMAAFNADSISFAALGSYFSEKCNLKTPMPIFGGPIRDEKIRKAHEKALPPKSHRLKMLKWLAT